jgi:primosomal protein N' (replication factor Y)
VSARALIARVVPDLTGLDKHFDYVIPPALAEHIQIGAIVRVPLGARRIRGWVVDVTDAAATETESLKELAAFAGHGPPAGIVALARWASWRWAGRLRPFLVAASPPKLVKRLPAASIRHGDAPKSAVALPAGGGVIRIPPAEAPDAVIIAAAGLGPVLVVTPSVEGAAALARRLRSVGFSVATVPDQWADAAAGVDIVIGTRVAAFAPCAGLAAIVVVDEHDEALQEERTPTWHARDVALERARRANVLCWLISPVPSLTALHWAAETRHSIVRPSRVDERSGWPILEVIDRSDDEPWKTSLVTSRLLAVARDPSVRLVCVLNTLGRARRLACRVCRAATVCEVCGAAVSQDRTGGLVCARCGTGRPFVCQACGSTNPAGLGVGVARLRDELARATRRTVIEVSSEADDAPVGDAPISDAPIVVGTEAALHRVRSADVVAFMDFDDELLAPRYRAGEQALTLLARAARLVGGRGSGGRIIVQARLARHDVLDAVLHADPGRFAAAELARREHSELPPFAALAVVEGRGSADAARRWLEPAPDQGLRVEGPAASRWLVRARAWSRLANGLAALGPRPPGVRVEVDPPRV